MEELPENVKHDLLKLVPAYLFTDITSFVFYDNHPHCRVKIEVTICTNKGEIIELCRRQPVLTFIISSEHRLKQIYLYRSSKCKMFYVVLAGNDLFILSRKDELVCDIRVCNVVSHQVYDFNNVGMPHLRVSVSDDAVPVIFDEEFKMITDRIRDLTKPIMSGKEVNIPLETDLDVKLAITRYNYAYNLKSLENMKNLRQVAAFLLYQRIHPNLSSSVFNNGLQELRGALKIIAETPWIKICNGKVVLVLPIRNENPDPLEEIQILLHSSESASLTYTTKLFQNVPEPPYWQEIKTQKLMNDTVASIAVVADLKELKDCVINGIEFEGLIMYKENGRGKLVPFQKVSLSVLDTLRESFDVLASNEFDKNDFLAIVATSHKTDLLLRYIQQECINLQETVRTYLKMEKLVIADNVIVHKKSPYHNLSGVVIKFERECYDTNNYTASVYSRNESQVLCLIHCINDAVPSRVLITTPKYKITALHNDLLPYSEVTRSQLKKVNLQPLIITLLHQIVMLLKYYDCCMAKMSEGRNVEVSTIGSVIDVFACGVSKFKELKKCLSETATQSIDWMYVEPAEQRHVAENESMVVERAE